jgi:hypothetical protein
VIETPLPCNIGDVLPGVLRDAEGKIHPFQGRVLERGAAEPPYAGTLVIGPSDLPLGRPFDPV